MHSFNGKVCAWISSFLITVLFFVLSKRSDYVLDFIKKSWNDNHSALSNDFVLMVTKYTAMMSVSRGSSIHHLDIQLMFFLRKQ